MDDQPSNKKFVPKLPEENHNVTDIHPLKDFAGSITLLLIALGIFIFFFGRITKIAVSYIDFETERNIFLSDDKEKQDESNRKNGFHDSKNANKYLKNLVSTLVVEKYPHYESLEVLYMCEKAPNAFAYPGGLIIVTSGLLKRIASEDALAFVLAHEVGHFHNRHHLKRISRQVMWGIVLSLVGSSGAIEEILATSGGLLSLSYSRDAEREADDFAKVALQDRYSIRKAAEFFDVIEEYRKSESFSMSVPSFLSTHPDSEERKQGMLNFDDSQSRDAKLIPREIKAEIADYCLDKEDISIWDKKKK